MPSTVLFIVVCLSCCVALLVVFGLVGNSLSVAASLLFSLLCSVPRSRRFRRSLSSELFPVRSVCVALQLVCASKVRVVRQRQRAGSRRAAEIARQESLRSSLAAARAAMLCAVLIPAHVCFCSLLLLSLSADRVTERTERSCERATEEGGRISCCVDQFAMADVQMMDASVEP